MKTYEDLINLITGMEGFSDTYIFGMITVLSLVAIILALIAIIKVVNQMKEE